MMILKLQISDFRQRDLSQSHTVINASHLKLSKQAIIEQNKILYEVSTLWQR